MPVVCLASLPFSCLPFPARGGRGLLMVLWSIWRTLLRGRDEELGNEGFSGGVGGRFLGLVVRCNVVVWGAPGVKCYLDALARSSYSYNLHSCLVLARKNLSPAPSQPSYRSVESGLNAPSTRRIRIVLQLEQQLPHPLLGAPLSTTTLPLATQICQFRNPLPTRPSRCGILTILNELGGLTCCLGLLLVGLAVVGFIKVVNIAAGSGDCFFLSCGGGGVAAGNVGFALLTPFSAEDSVRSGILESEVRTIILLC